MDSVYQQLPGRPEPEPHFLEKDLAGWPIWAHLLLGIATLGLYFLILPFVVLFDAAQKAFAKVVAGAVALVAGALFLILKKPAQALYRQARRLMGRRI
ncbi:hypothetical protein Q0Z83_008170 [Actinoplanes sichuanensis]|nr:hypothetical protein Q0Z83_008170 [Actinoplanes sichuanensis]